jgi:hypothetical protein
VSIIPSTAIAIDGATAWLIMDEPDHDETMRWANLDRTCHTCGGTGTNRVNVNRSLKGLKGCAPCCGTGRHTFEIPTSEVFIAGDGENAIRITALTVHVVEVLLIYPIFGVGDASLDRTIPHIMMDDTGAWYLDGDQGIRNITLSTSAAPGKYAVRLALHESETP